MVVSLSNQKCRFSGESSDVRSKMAKNMKYSGRNRDCFALVFKVEFGSREASQVYF